MFSLKIHLKKYNLSDQEIFKLESDLFTVIFLEIVNQYKDRFTELEINEMKVNLVKNDLKNFIRRIILKFSKDEQKKIEDDIIIPIIMNYLVNVLGFE